MMKLTDQKPDWIAVFLGTTCAFAIAGIASLVGNALRLITIHPFDPRYLVVIKVLWLFGSVCVSGYVGGFVTGMVLVRRETTGAAIHGLLVWELTLVSFWAIGWFGYPTLPGMVITRTADAHALQAITWMALQCGVPMFFAMVFGAIQGNKLVRAPERPAAERPAEEKKAA